MERRGTAVAACGIAAAAVMTMSSIGVSGQAGDMTGGADHPVLSRYAGSVIAGYEVRKFDEFLLPLGPVGLQGQYPNQALLPVKSEKVEGKVTRILYVAPPERTTLEVMRNYELELKKSGFAALYSCAANECGRVDGLVQVVYPNDRQLRPYVFTVPQELRYLAAKRTAPSGTIHVSIVVARNGNPGVRGFFNRVVVMTDIIEHVAMDTGMVTVDAAAMAKDIAQTGHVALYGILFDTNKADVKPESHRALQEIAALLKQKPGLNLLVVGHTDSVGGFEANMALSDRRAAAVLRELATKYGIGAARLRAVGVGMSAPVAPNDTEEGRARNRRVELVKQ